VHIKRLNHVDQFHNEGMNVSCKMTYILPMAQVVYTGDENGRVVSLLFSDVGVTPNYANALNSLVRMGLRTTGGMMGPPGERTETFQQVTSIRVPHYLARGRG
jgi:hypothetical protein